MDKEYDNLFGQWIGTYSVCNREERKFTEFCEIHVLEMLNGKYGED